MVEALSGFASAYELARSAARRGARLEALLGDAAVDERVELAELLADGRLLTPIDHPDPAHCLITGTGLTHLGSAQARDAMHEVTKQDESKLSDSMRMFRLGLEGGRTNGTVPGVAPEWFYKGDGSIVVSPGQPLASPRFALDGGEEAEIAALYLIDDGGRPCRLGYALGNEFSDHVLERQNYLYLAHSKLRPCSFGPELLLGDLPDHVQGKVGVVRGEERDLAGRVAERRGQHVPRARQSGASPLQISAVPPAGRHPCPLPGRRDPELHRRHQGGAWATCSRSSRRASARPCATRWRSPMTKAWCTSGRCERTGPAEPARPGGLS